MAEEEVVAPAASPVPSDHKRKLDCDPTEQLAESKEEADAENGVAVSDSLEAKRLRLDDNEPDELVAGENGFQGEKLEEPIKEEEEEAVIPNEANEQAENGENPSEEAEETVKTEQIEGTGEQLEQSSADNHEMGVDEQVKVENSEADIAQDPPIDENTQPVDEGAQLEMDDGSTISRKIEVPNAKVGVLIGKAGETIRSLQYNSGAKIQIMRDADADRDAPTRPVELVGTLSSIAKAEKLINAVIAEADAGGSPSLVARGLAITQATGAVDLIEIQVPNEKVGLIIGRGGDTIKGLQTRSGARIQLINSEGEQSNEKIVRVTGDKKQIEMAKEMIKEVMNQTVRPSSHSGGVHHHSYRPRGPMGPSQWGPRSHPAQSMPYDYQRRGPYPSQNAHYQAPNYGGYPQQMAPRGNFGSSWDQRPHSMQGPSPQGGGYDYYGRQGASGPLSSSIPGHGPGPSPASAMGPPPQSNYNYGQPHGPDYAHPPYPHTAPQHSYGHGYEEHKYDNHATGQHFYGGHGASQPGYTQSGTQPGFAPQQPYGKPPSYGMPSQGHHLQTYGPPTSQPGDMAYPGPTASQYGSNVPPQQQYPYASGGSMQQSYPQYGSAPTNDGYGQAPTATAPVYPQQGSQPVPGYGQPAGQTAPSYAQAGAGGYGQYPSSQQGYAEQPAAASYGYQGPQDPSYGGGAGSTYSAPSGQPGYAQPATNQPGYDQNAPQSSSYAATATAGGAPVPYGKTVSPQPGYPQYDSSQMYTAPR
ncbi:hypothetical protein SLE2022_327040 [Rubroshorea leprosula]